MNIRRCILSFPTAVLVSVCALSSYLHAGVISTFDSGFDGWTFTSGVSWQSSGGNLGGYLRFVDSGPADGGQIIAPSSFLGEWTGFENGTLSFDFAVFETQAPTFTRSVQISGPGGVAIWTGPNFGGVVDWTPVTAAILESEWDVSSGDWNNLLANVTELRVFMRDSSNAIELTGIDNVRLSAVPEPSSSALLLIGASLFAIRRCRPRSKDGWRSKL
jgi:hypothetical protein